MKPRTVRSLSFLSILSLVVAAWGAVTARAVTPQSPPKVAFVLPTEGEGFFNPPEIPILVEAADSDGYVKSVEVFTELGSLGAITPNPASAQPANPFRWTWLNPPAGEHKLVAKAIDNDGNESFSESLVISVRRDVSPSAATLTFVKPQDGAVLPLSDPITIQVTAVDPNGDIRHVEFFANGVFIGRSEHLTKDAVIPGRPREHYLEWKPVDVGFFRLEAKAIDTQGNPVVSKPIGVSVGSTLAWVSIEATVSDTSEPGPTVRVRPGVFTIRRKADLTAPLTVNLRYEGSATPDLDYKRLPETVTFAGGVAEVELLVEGIEDSLSEGVESVIATLIVPPVVGAPDDVVVGVQSAKVLIHDTIVSGGAILEITAPKDGEVFKPGETLIVEATAIDPHGYISRVEFYDFEKEIGVSEIFFIRAPDPGTPIHHTFEWQNLPPGEHLLTARAIDSNGNRVISKAVRVQAGSLWTLPVVEVTALDPEAMEFPPFVDAIDPARFSIKRSGGDLEKELYVVFSLHGTAEPGKDYRHPGRTARFAPGETEVVVEIVPESDELNENMETVAVRLEDPLPISSLPAPPTPYETTWYGRAAAAVIYDRERPAQSALAFALPTTGEVYQQFQTIPMIVAAFHPTQELSHVDFFAGEKLIGSSDILSGRIAPGGLIMHRFEWKEPMTGEQTLTARAPLSDGSALVSGKVVVTVMSSVQPAVVLEVEATDFEGTESGSDQVPDPIVFTIRRAGGPKDVAVTVAFELSGTAQNGNDYAPLEGKVMLGAGEESVPVVIKPLLDQALEGDEIVMLTLVAPICPAIFPTPPWCFHIGPSGAARALIRDATVKGIAVSVLSPRNGSVFTAGEAITITAAARSDSSAIERLDIFVDDRLVESTKLPELSVTVPDLGPGSHVLTARAVAGTAEVLSAPSKILVREVDAVAFVQRKLPAGYVPGKSFSVLLAATPSAGTSSYQVEEYPPAGWAITDVTPGGVFDASAGRITFGPFNDATPRELGYSITPPIDAKGVFGFKAASSADGRQFPVGGSFLVSDSSQVHPADRSPADYTITLDELNAYALAWKKGEGANNAADAIGLPLVTRAGQIWKDGEKYTFDPSENVPPACYKSISIGPTPDGSLPTISRYAEREITWPSELNKPVSVRINVVSDSAARAYGLQEQLPAGWSAVEVSHEGQYDPVSNSIRWGLFLDGQNRLLTYQATPPPSNDGTPRGTISFDGSFAEVRGDARAVAKDAGASFAQFKRIERLSDGTVHLQLSGPREYLSRLEVSTDLRHWTEITPVYLSEGEVGYQDKPDSTTTQRFYRIR